jgi:glycosyltransferase involved in cell wall biosynthesis
MAIKILHIISGLSTGGAEMMLYKLLLHLREANFDNSVVSMCPVGPIGEKIQALQVPVRTLGMRRKIPNPIGLYRLVRWLQQDPPHLIQTWMYHADLLGGLAAKFVGGIPVVWNIRHGPFDKSGKRSSLWAMRACVPLSNWLPSRIICCSEVSQQIHIALGYPANRMIVIPNGFDLAAFKPDPEARLSVRRELGLPSESLLIGLVGRFDTQKDHRTFIEAAARLQADSSHPYFVLCGDEVTWENAQLASWIEAAGVRQRCHLLGRREDMPRLTAALDIATSSSSHGEAFSNVIGEAMACGVPCVATDVEDAAFIIGDTGRIVPPRDPYSLAQNWHALIEVGQEGRNRLGCAARRRIAEHFNLPTVATRYEQLYEEVSAPTPPFPQRVGT